MIAGTPIPDRIAADPQKNENVGKAMEQTRGAEFLPMNDVFAVLKAATKLKS